MIMQNRGVFSIAPFTEYSLTFIYRDLTVTINFPFLYDAYSFMCLFNYYFLIWKGKFDEVQLVMGMGAKMMW